MEKIKIEDKDYFIITVSDNYETVKHFDFSKKYESYELKENEVFIVASETHEFSTEEIKLFVLQIFQKIF